MERAKLDRHTFHDYPSVDRIRVRSTLEFLQGNDDRKITTFCSILEKHLWL